MAKAILVVIFLFAFIFIIGYFLKLRADQLHIPSALPIEESQNVLRFDIVLHSQMDYGSYFTDNKGRALYFFAKDVDGESHCQDSCLEKWSVFFQPNLKIYDAIDSSDFGEIVRADGKKQNTWKGWPLYYFLGDQQEGDFNGDGQNGLWFLAKPDYDVFVASDDQQEYLVDQSGFTLYALEECDQNCQKIWPQFELSDFFSLPKDLKSSLLSALDLHYYSGDISRGEKNALIRSENWSLVDPFQK